MLNLLKYTRNFKIQKCKKLFSSAASSLDYLNICAIRASRLKHITVNVQNLLVSYLIDFLSEVHLNEFHCCLDWTPSNKDIKDFWSFKLNISRWKTRLNKTRTDCKDVKINRHGFHSRFVKNIILRSLTVKKRTIKKEAVNPNII